MPHRWLSTVRGLLRDLRRTEKHAKPDKSQLERLNITIRHTHDIYGLENICIIEKFLHDDTRRRETDLMVVILRPSMSADFCSKYVSSVLFGWIVDDMSRQMVDRVRIKRKPVLRIPNDTYSDGVRAEMTAFFRQRSKGKHMYISLVIRKEHESDTLITSAELYALFSTAAKQAWRQPHVDLVEVRMLVVYSRWVQIVTAKMTRIYITSIIEGWDNIANQMEICHTPWLNFMTILGQQCVLLAAFESTRIRSPDVEARVPLRDMATREQNSKSSKRTLPTAEKCDNNKQKVKHTPDGTKDTLPIF
ncbi:hypothetical protein BJ875DRAFT_490303 [Amylocarpus encephaloides]|uniref:Uncharacterized protein n=1 Tax=Amylocarpus encephaloides TaxID=45428 RepID=A0A9P7Y7F4_9HELO|nr:hypothetical protein BJ875DRAFT_490303 [Amylocarpus encephaloides]